jgi:hypothetical protein
MDGMDGMVAVCNTNTVTDNVNALYVVAVIMNGSGKLPLSADACCNYYLAVTCARLLPLHVSLVLCLVLYLIPLTASMCALRAYSP